MLTHDDLADAAAVWNERVGPDYSLSVGVIGHHFPAEMDPDRALGALLRAEVTLLLTITAGETVIFERTCPYSREALLESVRALSAVLLAD